METKEFIIGRWYSIKDYSRSYRKCSHNLPDSAGYMFYSERINDTKYDNESGECGNRNNRLKLVDLSEILDYLPNNHPDKLDYYKQTNTDYKYLILFFKKLNII
jgi:hypothetical protein